MSDAAPAAAPASRRRLAPFVALAIAAVLGSLFWVLARGGGGDTSSTGVVESHLLGRAAPAMEADTVDDGTFDLSRRKGSWVVLNFFNSTCVPCKAEHPELVQFVAQQQSIGAEGAEFYTVMQYDDDVDRVRAFFADRGGDWPVVIDDAGRIFVSFGVAQVPETFIIDPDGVVRVRWAGQIDAAQLAVLVQQQRDLYELGA